MDITFTITLTDKQIPELIGLLHKISATPDPRVVTVIEPRSGTPAAEAASPITPEAPAAAAAPLVTMAQVQAAAGAFMDAAPGNLSVLQDILAELGVQSLPQLKPDQQQLFAASLRGYGVSI